MRVLSLVYESDAGSGVFADEVRARGHELEEWLPARAPIPRPLTDYGALIAFGGGMHVDQEDAHPWLRGVLDLLRDALALQLPTLGICLGAQMLARVAGAEVGPGPCAEWGWQPVTLTPAAAEDPLLDTLPTQFDVLQWHTYRFGLPPQAEALAHSPFGLQAFRLGETAWGVQWHPEVTAETVLLWGKRFPPAPDGTPVAIELDALSAEVERRIEQTNADGRALCARFLAASELRHRSHDRAT